MAQEVRTKDFSKIRPKILITVDGESYEAKPALTLPTMQAVQAMQRRMKEPNADHIAEFSGIFTVLLKEVDGKRFAEKLLNQDEPVDPGQLGEMVAWLMEQYAARPTEESSASADGSSAATPGTPSTGGVSPNE